jgi:urease accessory protein
MATAITRQESRPESKLESQPEQRRVRAMLALDFQRSTNSGHTHLRASTQQPPLRVIRAFAREDGSCLAHLHNVSGGVLGGDHLALDVKIGPCANVQITTTGATRIYRPRAISAPAEQHNKIEIAAGALLEYVPDPIIPYAGARFSQSTEIHLAPGAALFWWEVLAPGREARGEIFDYERVEMRAEIFASGRIIAAERVRLEPKARALKSLARLGAFRYWITFYICREGLEPARWLALENELRDVARPFAASAESLWGISALAAHGLAIRGLARRSHGILHALWRAAKLSLYGREPILPRKVN